VMGVAQVSEHQEHALTTKCERRMSLLDRRCGRHGSTTAGRARWTAGATKQQKRCAATPPAAAAPPTESLLRRPSCRPVE
jgi:hypothetical protein